MAKQLTAYGFPATGELPDRLTSPCCLTGCIRWRLRRRPRGRCNAIAAGFDGVEIHGANGCLVHQFVAPHTNQRTDGWGGSVEGRIRFGVEAAAAVADAIGGERVGFRTSPGNPYNDIAEDDLGATCTALVTELAPLGLAHLHMLEGPHRDLTLQLREEWSAALSSTPSPTPTSPARTCWD